MSDWEPVKKTSTRREIPPTDSSSLPPALHAFPNNIALSLSWATPQSNEMKHGQGAGPLAMTSRLVRTNQDFAMLDFETASRRCEPSERRFVEQRESANQRSSQLSNARVKSIATTD